MNILNTHSNACMKTCVQQSEGMHKYVHVRSDDGGYLAQNNFNIT